MTAVLETEVGCWVSKNERDKSNGLHTLQREHMILNISETVMETFILTWMVTSWVHMHAKIHSAMLKVLCILLWYHLRLHWKPKLNDHQPQAPLFASFYWRVPHPHGTRAKPETRQVSPSIAGGLEGAGEWLMIPPHLPGNRNPPQTDRQTDRGQDRETSLPSRFSPSAPTWKESQTLTTQHPSPPPTLAAFVGPPQQGEGPEAASHRSPSLWFAPGSSVPLSFLSLRPSHPYIFYHLLGPSLSLSFPGPPCLWGSSDPASEGPHQALSTQDAGLTQPPHSPWGQGLSAAVSSSGV